MPSDGLVTADEMAGLQQPRHRCALTRVDQMLTAPPQTWRAPQKSHRSASRAAPTRSPRTRRHSAAYLGTHAKIETKTSPEQAKRRYRRLSAVPICGGQGQDRTVDLPLFRRTLIPTELPD